MDEWSVRSMPVASGFRLIVVLSMLAAFAPLSTDMYLAAFPALSAAFHTDAGTVQGTLSVFVFGMAVGQPLYGPVIDRYGRRRPLQIGVLAFVVASLGLCVAPTIDVFIGLRLLQAIDGCGGMIICRAIVSDLYSEREAIDRFSVIMLVGSLAPIIAPVAGGLIVASLGWRAVFLFLTAFGLLCLAFIGLFLPETLPRHRRSTTSFRGTAVVSGQLLRSREFVLPTLAGALAFAGLFAFISGSPSVFMSFFGIGRGAYGWVFASVVVGMMAFSQGARRLLRSRSPDVVFVVSMLVNVFGALALVLFARHVSALVFVLLSIVSLSGIPLAAAACTSKAMSAAGAGRGSGSALLGMLQFGFAGVASSLVGHFYDGTPLAMTVSMLVAGCLSLFMFYPVLRRGTTGRRVGPFS